MSEPSAELTVPPILKELQPQTELAVAFLFHCKTVENFETKLQQRLKEIPLTTVMLNEYDLSIEEIATNIDKLREIAQQNHVDIVLAANIGPWRLEKEMTWDQAKESCIHAGAILLDDHTSAAEVDDSVGYYFGSDGRIFFFPKYGGSSLHIIPQTNVAVTICGEIGQLTPEIISQSDASVILNPAREGDDPFLKYRMLGLAKPDLSDADIWKEILRDDRTLPEDVSIIDFSDADSVLDFMVKSRGDKLSIPQEQFRQNYLKTFRRMKAIAQNEKNNNSMYVRRIGDDLLTKNVLVLRCDGQYNSGILNPLPGMRISNVVYDNDYATMNISF